VASYQAQLAIPVPPVIVRAILLEPAALPEWNPGFRSVGGPERARPDTRYPIAVRGGLTGFLEYAAIGDRRIEVGWHVAGLTEAGSWALTPEGNQTRVRYRVERTGPLTVLTRAGTGDLAGQRLRRLSLYAVARLGSRYANTAVTWWCPRGGARQGTEGMQQP
jgi:Polyketide cyclase / dehydrase and lipid transport